MSPARAERPRTFEEFWPHYLGEHRKASTRAWHVAGTHLGVAVLLAAAVLSPGWLPLAPALGYGFAWIGHFFFERNHPATFAHPLWSLRGDLRMIRLTWAGKMEAEVARLTGP